MTVSAPRRPPSPAPTAPDSKPLDRDEIEALVEALIEEAWREQRRRHRRYWALAALAAVVGVVVLILLDGGAASQTASPGVSPRMNSPAQAATPMIAFTRSVAGLGRSETYVVNADGSRLRNLTHDWGLEGEPVWSPDGRTIAFERPGFDGIWVMNADGSERRSLTQGRGGGGAPSWSPDGRRIAFSRNRGGTPDVYVMNADGSGPRRLVRDGLLPAWSPDGRTIAFVRVHFVKCRRVPSQAPCIGSVAIHVVNADGSNLRQLTPDSAVFGFGSWSPDGRRIAFVSKRDGNPEIYVMNADGSEQRRLTRSALRDRAPVWSPDGQTIAFVRSKFNTFEHIYVMNADGSGQRRLIRNGVAPRWSPDGRMIAFARAVAAPPRPGSTSARRPIKPWQRDVWVANADGSGERNLSQSPRAVEWLYGWSPGQ